jgi:hypothetical protein
MSLDFLYPHSACNWHNYLWFVLAVSMFWTEGYLERSYNLPVTYKAVSCFITAVAYFHAGWMCLKVSVCVCVHSVQHYVIIFMYASNLNGGGGVIVQFWENFLCFCVCIMLMSEFNLLCMSYDDDKLHKLCDTLVGDCCGIFHQSLINVALVFSQGGEWLTLCTIWDIGFTV